MKKVYVVQTAMVTEDDYEKNILNGVFTDKEKAIDVMEKAAGKYCAEFSLTENDIEEMTETGDYQQGVDPRTGKEYISCTITVDGDYGFWITVTESLIDVETV